MRADLCACARNSPYYSGETVTRRGRWWRAFFLVCGLSSLAISKHTGYHGSPSFSVLLRNNFRSACSAIWRLGSQSSIHMLLVICCSGIHALIADILFPNVKKGFRTAIILDLFGTKLAWRVYVTPR